MSQRLEFVNAVVHRPAGVSLRAIFAQFGISERTGHKWIARFVTGGPAALADRSHAPHVPAHQLPRVVTEPILALREAEPTWGARKLRDVLQREQPDITWPAASTITTLLKRAGLVTPLRRSHRDRSLWAQAALTPARAPNDVWAADFKGEFQLGSGPYCYPLTISDLYSRYVLLVHGLPGTGSALTQAQCRRCFQEHGLPRVIRTDNGVPFGTPGALGGLSTLGVWWIRLGIRPERITRGVPQENGSHERMHRNLKAEATLPPSETAPPQQGRFDRWRRTYNERRPHDALGGTPPADHYVASPRPLPRRLPLLEYPAHVALRRVNHNGNIKWRGHDLFLTRVLAGEYISIEETGAAEWTFAFGPLTLGTFCEDTLSFTEAVAWHPTTI